MRTWLRYALEITKTYPEKYGRGVSAREKNINVATGIIRISAII